MQPFSNSLDTLQQCITYYSKVLCKTITSIVNLIYSGKHPGQGGPIVGQPQVGGTRVGGTVVGAALSVEPGGPLSPLFPFCPFGPMPPMSPFLPGGSRRSTCSG